MSPFRDTGSGALVQPGQPIGNADVSGRVEELRDELRRNGGEDFDKPSPARSQESKRIRDRLQTVANQISEVKSELRTAENRSVTFNEKREQIEKLLDESEKLERELETEERLERHEYMQNQQAANAKRVEHDQLERIAEVAGEERAERIQRQLVGSYRAGYRELENRLRSEEYEVAFWQKIVAPESLSHDQVRLIQEIEHEQRAQTQESQQAGGILVPEDWDRTMRMIVTGYGGIFDLPIMRTSTPHGRDIHHIFNEEVQEGAIVSYQAGGSKNISSSTGRPGTPSHLTGHAGALGQHDSRRNIPQGDRSDVPTGLSPDGDDDRFTGAPGAYDGDPANVATKIAASLMGKKGIGEGIDVTKTLDVGGFSEKIDRPYLFTTLNCEVPATLLQDEVYNIMRVIRRVMGERIQRVVTRLLMTDGLGHEYNQPQSLLLQADNVAPLGYNANTQNAGVIDRYSYSAFRHFDHGDHEIDGDHGALLQTAAVGSFNRKDFINLQHSLEPAYRGSPNLYFTFNDDTLRRLRMLDVGSADARPLWEPSMRQGAPNMIEGTPYAINRLMPSFGTTRWGSGSADTAANSRGHRFVLYGDMSQFCVRMVPGFRIQRLTEIAAQRNSVVFIGFQRWGSLMYINKAVKALAARNV